MFKININEELIPSFESISSLNVVEKLQEFIMNPVFVKNKMHIKIFKYYLNDDKIFKDRLERFVNTKPHEGIDDMTTLEMILILSSSTVYKFEGLLNENEKKVLIVQFLDILDYDEKGDVELENEDKASKYLNKTLHFYDSQKIKYFEDNLKNVELLNQILDLLNEEVNRVKLGPKSGHDLFDDHINYYSKKMQYYKDMYFIEKEQKNDPSTGDEKDVSPYKNYTNVFHEKMEISKAVQHFKVFTTAKSKNGEPFLTEKQFDNFIKRAFCGLSNIAKQKFNMAPRGEKFKIQYKFREFYESYYDYFGTGHVQDKFVKLLTDNFVGWDFKNVKDNFKRKPSKTI